MQTSSLTDQYYCEKTVYNSVEEAKGNQNCIEYSFNDLI